jgi:hypothetical protein
MKRIVCIALTALMPWLWLTRPAASSGARKVDGPHSVTSGVHYLILDSMLILRYTSAQSLAVLSLVIHEALIIPTGCVIQTGHSKTGNALRVCVAGTRPVPLIFRFQVSLM